MSNSREPEDRATIRRAPKLYMFLAVGGALGAIVTFILTALFPADPLVGFGALFGYFLLYGVPAGVVLGAAVGLILDWRSRRRASSVTVERETVVEELEAPAGPADPADPAGPTSTER